MTTEPTHPNAIRLEALAAGDADADARAHVDGCAACREYVDALSGAAAERRPSDAETAAFTAKITREASSADSGAPRTDDAVGETEDAARERGGGATVTRLVWVAAPLLAIAAAIFLLLRTAEPPPEKLASVTPAPSVETIRFKGKLQLALVRDRGGQQARLTSSVGVREGDRLRAEISIDAERPVTVGVLMDDGTWAVILPPTLLSPGTHFSDKSVRIDDRPTAGYVIAGEPGAVDRARAARSFEEVSVMPIVVEP